MAQNTSSRVRHNLGASHLLIRINHRQIICGIGTLAPAGNLRFFSCSAGRASICRPALPSAYSHKDVWRNGAVTMSYFDTVCPKLDPMALSMVPPWTCKARDVALRRFNVWRLIGSRENIRVLEQVVGLMTMPIIATAPVDCGTSAVSQVPSFETPVGSSGAPAPPTSASVDGGRRSNQSMALRFPN